MTANSFTTTLGGARDRGGRDRQRRGCGTSGAATTAAPAGSRWSLPGSTLGACLLAARIGRTRLGPEGAAPPTSVGRALATVAAGLLEGARHIRSHRAAGAVLVVITLHRFFSGLAFVLVLLVFTPHGYLSGGIGDLGETLDGGRRRVVWWRRSSPPASCAGSAHRPGWCSPSSWPRWSTGLCFPPYTRGWLVVAGVGLGFAAQAAKICVDTLVQESIDDAFRGRVFALYDTLFNVSFVAAAVLAAAVVPADGHSLPVVALVATGYLVTALGYAGWLKRSAVRG